MKKEKGMYTKERESTMKESVIVINRKIAEKEEKNKDKKRKEGSNGY